MYRPLRHSQRMPHQHGLHHSISNHTNSKEEGSRCNNQEAVEDIAVEDASDVLGVEDGVKCLHPCHSLAGNI